MTTKPAGPAYEEIREKVKKKIKELSGAVPAPTAKDMLGADEILGGITATAPAPQHAGTGLSVSHLTTDSLGARDERQAAYISPPPGPPPAEAVPPGIEQQSRAAFAALLGSLAGKNAGTRAAIWITALESPPAVLFADAPAAFLSKDLTGSQSEIGGDLEKAPAGSAGKPGPEAYLVLEGPADKGLQDRIQKALDAASAPGRVKLGDPAGQRPAAAGQTRPGPPARKPPLPPAAPRPPATPPPLLSRSEMPQIPAWNRAAIATHNDATAVRFVFFEGNIILADGSNGLFTGKDELSRRFDDAPASVPHGVYHFRRAEHTITLQGESEGNAEYVSALSGLFGKDWRIYPNEKAMVKEEASRRVRAEQARKAAEKGLRVRPRPPAEPGPTPPAAPPPPAGPIKAHKAAAWNKAAMAAHAGTTAVDFIFFEGLLILADGEDGKFTSGLKLSREVGAVPADAPRGVYHFRRAERTIALRGDSEGKTQYASALSELFGESWRVYLTQEEMFRKEGKRRAEKKQAERGRTAELGKLFSQGVRDYNRILDGKPGTTIHFLAVQGSGSVTRLALSADAPFSPDWAERVEAAGETALLGTLAAHAAAPQKGLFGRSGPSPVRITSVTGNLDTASMIITARTGRRIAEPPSAAPRQRPEPARALKTEEDSYGSRSRDALRKLRSQASSTAPGTGEKGWNAESKAKFYQLKDRGGHTAIFIGFEGDTAFDEPVKALKKLKDSLERQGLQWESGYIYAGIAEKGRFTKKYKYGWLYNSTGAKGAEAPLVEFIRKSSPGDEVHELEHIPGSMDYETQFGRKRPDR